MSDLREFLNFVRPWSGPDHKIVNATWGNIDPTTKVKPKMQRGAVDLEDVAVMLEFYSGKGEDVWFASQSYQISSTAVAQNNGKWFKGVRRRQQDITAIHNFYCDLDVKPGAYATLQDAVNAIYAFCAKLTLPPPSLLVCSGYGLHVYWRVEEDMTLHQWQPVAAALRKAMEAEGITADHGCTIDSARILRPPGTWNYKDPHNPQPVSIIPGSTKAVYKLEWLRDPLVPFMGPRLATVGGKPTSAMSQITQNLNTGLDESQPVSLHNIASMCGVLDHEFKTRGATATQPLWSLVALACAFDEEPWETFQELSDGYPTYDENAARDKLEEKLAIKGKTGWPSCQAFSIESAICHECPHFPLGKSPLNLRPKPAVDPGVVPGAAPMLPPNYWQDHDGTIWTNIKDDEGKLVGRQVATWAVGDGYLEDVTGDLLFACQLGSQRKVIRVPARSARNHDIRSSLHSQGFYSPEAGHRILGNFIVAWMTHLSRSQTARGRLAHLGWDDDDGFTHGPVRWVAGVPSEAVYRDQNIPDMYSTKGDLKVWRKLADFITGCKNPGLEALFATGFAAPLCHLISPGAVLLAPFSKRTSAGKTTALRCASAIWGHPVRCMAGLNDSSKSIDKALGEIRSLPVIHDELRTKQVLDDIVLQTFRLGQGKGRTTLNQDRTTRQGELFNTILVAASNYSLAELITKATKDSDAGAQRVFEIEMFSYADAALDTNITKMVKDIESNHGHAGEVYSAYLSRNVDRIRKELLEWNAKFSAHVGARGGERFAIPLISALVHGAKYANELGLTSFNIPAMVGYLIEQLDKRREHLEREVKTIYKTSTVEELINDLLQSGRVIFSDSFQTGTQPINYDSHQGSDDVKRMGTPLGHLAKDTGMLRINWNAFVDWLVERQEQSPRSVRGVLKETYKAFDVKAGLGQGLPGIAMPIRVSCLQVDTNKFQTP